MLLEGVDAADQRRFAGAGGAADDDAFSSIDREVDVLQDVKFAEPLVDTAHLNDAFCGRGGGGGVLACSAHDGLVLNDGFRCSTASRGTASTSTSRSRRRSR